MRIAQLLSGTGNGASRYCLVLSKELAARGHEVTLFYTGRPLVEQVDLGNVRFLEVDMRRRPAAIRHVRLAMRNLGIEVMHTHVSRAHALGAILRTLDWRRGLVATAHAQHVQLHWVFNDRVIAACEESASFHHRYNRVPRKRFAIIPNFADVRRFTPVTPARRQRAREALGLPADAFVIGSVGTERRKTPSDLVRALAALDRRGVRGHLVLIGAADDESNRELDAVSREFGIGTRVLRLSWRNDVPDLLPAFDAYAQMAHRGDMPTNILEAMASGIPVFSTRVAGVADVMPVADHGNLVSFGDVEGLADRLAAASRSPDALVPMRARMIAAVASLAPEIVVGRIEEVYADLIADRRRRWGPPPFANA